MEFRQCLYGVNGHNSPQCSSMAYYIMHSIMFAKFAVRSNSSPIELEWVRYNPSDSVPNDELPFSVSCVEL